MMRYMQGMAILLEEEYVEEKTKSAERGPYTNISNWSMCSPHSSTVLWHSVILMSQTNKLRIRSNLCHFSQLVPVSDGAWISMQEAWFRAAAPNQRLQQWATEPKPYSTITGSFQISLRWKWYMIWDDHSGHAWRINEFPNIIFIFRSLCHCPLLFSQHKTNQPKVPAIY